MNKLIAGVVIVALWAMAFAFFCGAPMHAIVVNSAIVIGLGAIALVIDMIAKDKGRK